MLPANDAQTCTPDANSVGLLAGQVDALRYDGHTSNPTEVAGILHSMMPADVRVLDVGCGTGSVTIIANSGRGNRVAGIEPDPQRAAIARERGFEVHVGYLDQAYIDNQGSFDVVMAADVLEHTAAPAEVLRLMVRALRRDGIILISVPNVAHWSVRWSLVFGSFEYEAVGIMDATHLRWFTARSIVALCNECGLDVVKIRQSAGTELPVYARGAWRLVHYRKSSIIRRLARTFPLLFGAQHVLLARPRT